MLERHADWPERLDAALRTSHARRFAWGEHDCCTFACDTVLAMTGTDLMASLRGRYQDALSAARLLRQTAGAGLEAVARLQCNQYWQPEVPPRQAQRGDLVLADVITLDGLRAEALGIVALDGRCALFAALDGLQALPLLACRIAWRIG